MQFNLSTAEIFIPDNIDVERALKRTTHMAICAHQDDIEIMAAGPILECYQQDDRWFIGVVVTDGRGSPRSGLYQAYSDEEMHLVRFKEQRKAATIGEYAAQVMLDYPSKVVKSASDNQPAEDLTRLLLHTNPDAVFTHNLADKHDTHVAVALRVITAIRRLPLEARPQHLYGCEVWRDLDWLIDSEKVAFDLTDHENLQAALLGVFDSQITGGKRYDLAAMGRRKANATFAESHGVDKRIGQSFAMDLTPLILNEDLEPLTFVQSHIQRFAADVTERIQKLS